MTHRKPQGIYTRSVSITMPTQLSSLLVKGQILTRVTTLVDADGGKNFYLNATNGFHVTLPTPKIGLAFTFVVKADTTRWDYVIKASSSADIIRGHVCTTDVDSATDADFEATGNNTIHFVSGTTVAGDKVELTCDGTYWYATGLCSVYNAITFQANSSASPSLSPSTSPSSSPSKSPSRSPSRSPSKSPSTSPSTSPSASQSVSPSLSPSVSPSPS